MTSSGQSKRAVLYRWDLDKTYLRTEFDTIRDLVRTALESAADKQSIPGAASLMRELTLSNPQGIHFLSGSPEQMRAVLEEKLRLDGVTWDSFVLKPSLAKMMRGRFRFLRDQTSYKLAALLQARIDAPFGVDEVMFGDDAEVDAFVYSLYADIASGRANRATLIQVLIESAAYPEDIHRLVHMARRIPRGDVVRRIFIHLERLSDYRRFDAFGSRVCAFFNYMQPTLILVQDGLLDAPAAFRVARELLEQRALTAEGLVHSFDDLLRRGFLARPLVDKLEAVLPSIQRESYGRHTEVLRVFGEQVAARGARMPAQVEQVCAEINYPDVFRADRRRALDGKARATRARGETSR